MKTILTVTTLTILMLSGCGGGTSSETSTQPQTPEVLSKASVLHNSAKSPTVLSENQVKSNPGYTHLTASGSRYKFD